MSTEDLVKEIHACNLAPQYKEMLFSIIDKSNVLNELTTNKNEGIATEEKLAYAQLAFESLVFEGVDVVGTQPFDSSDPLDISRVFYYKYEDTVGDSLKASFHAIFDENDRLIEAYALDCDTGSEISFGLSAPLLDNSRITQTEIRDFIKNLNSRGEKTKDFLKNKLIHKLELSPRQAEAAVQSYFTS